MRVGVLGPVEARAGTASVDLGTRKQRALVAALALHRGRPVAVDTIVDLLWHDRPPAGVTGTLQAYISGLRRTLEPDRPARAPATVLVTVEPGYALRLGPDDLDADSFVTLAGRTHRLLAPVTHVPGTNGRHDGGALMDPGVLAEAVAAIDQALSLWRGTPYLELADAPPAVAERARLEGLRLLALEDLALARLAQGQHGTVAAELEALTAEHPLRERLWALRAVALTRCGRQADALGVLARVRDVLAEELGLDPGPELQQLQAAILRHDPALDPVHPVATTPISATTPPVVHPPPADDGPWRASVRPQPSPSAEAPPGAAPSVAAQPTAAPVHPQLALPRLPPWPMVGRDAELVALTGLLDTADHGTPALASVVGEPGIGKSRLCHELTVLARARGAHVLVGRCSQDDGAPPLWPWAAVLRGLDQDLPVAGGIEDEGAQFRTWEAIVRALQTAAADRTVLVVLDDLHWADPSTLRVLRLLAESVEAGRLMLLATWREHPEPTGALAEVAETLARRHALRLRLDGLGAAEAGAVVASVAEAVPTEAEARALRRRTDGNPFFLVEYARLARERRDLTGLLAEPDPPSAVRDVLLRRLERLPMETLGALRGAAVVGRRFDVATVAAATGQDPDTLLDHLDPALAAGLIRDEGVDLFSFAHALVRDTVRSAIPSSRRARLHARVAEHLAGTPEREAEVAHHWLAAGPGHAARAWPAAVAAARLARRLHAHEQAVDLLRSAVGAMDLDRDAPPRRRYDVLMDLIDAYRWAGDWNGLMATVADAVAVADELGDVELLARAACSPTVGALWQSTGHGDVPVESVQVLRRALAALPPGDGVIRCRTMVSLANEVYYGSSVAERTELIDEALAMARRLGDPLLLLDCCEIAFVTLWRPATMAQRLAWAREAEQIARAEGYERTLTVAITLRAAVEGELGMVEQMWRTAAEAREHATRLRLPYGLLVLDNLELPWLAMAGRFAEAEQRLAGIAEMDRLMALHQSADALSGAVVSLRLWQGRAGDALPHLQELEGGPLPVGTTVAVYHLRAGDVAAARAYLAAHPVNLEHDNWFSLLDWSMAGEAALGLGDAALGAAAFERLAPYAGCVASAGSGSAVGPVDAFLALAAAATGDRTTASGHADRATEQCRAWEIPLVEEWLREQRERHGF